MTLDDLKAAHKDGHIIQVYLTGSKIWRDLPNPLWNAASGARAYRVKPTGIPEEFKNIKFRLFLDKLNLVTVVNNISNLEYTAIENSPHFKCWLSDEICFGDLYSG